MKKKQKFYRSVSQKEKPEVKLQTRFIFEHLVFIVYTTMKFSRDK